MPYPTPSVGVSPLIPPLPPAGVDQVPGAIVQAQSVFIEGLAAFQTGQAEQAAERFMAVAAGLAKAKGEPHWDVFAQNRLLAYRNAAIAWSVADKLSEGRAALTKVLDDDPLCREGLLELLAILGPEPQGGAKTAPPAATPAARTVEPAAAASAPPAASPAPAGVASAPGAPSPRGRR